MSVSRREFLQAAASTSAFMILTPGGPVPLRGGADAVPFKSELLPSVDEVWKWQVSMNQLGPKYTGNEAHGAFVEFLASNLKATGLEVTRDSFKFPRWNARRWALTARPATGAPFEAPVTSYYPYSGETPAAGVTGELVAQQAPATRDFGGAFKPSGDVKGKVAFIEMPITPPPYAEWYKPYGFHIAETTLPSDVSAVWSIFTPLLTDLKKAGAVGVVLAWTNVSDEQAAYQYTPFSRPLQGLPALWVGRETGARLRALAGTGARATVTLEADVFKDSPTDTLIATLPGTSRDEVIIVNTHTDGPNATEENGGLGVLALAKYFSRVPSASRRRTVVFVLATGHFALAYLPSIHGFMEQHPDTVKKAVGAITIEHLGCREWLDNPAMKYAATGRDELTLAITDFGGTARVMLDAVKDTADRRVAVVKPVPSKGLFFGEGGALSRAGVPTIGYIPIPSYLIAGPPDGCIDKLSKTLLHAQIEAFAKAMHRMDVMSAAELKGEAGSSDLA
jgi:hypothetical protein